MPCSGASQLVGRLLATPTIDRNSQMWLTIDIRLIELGDKSCPWAISMNDE